MDNIDFETLRQRTDTNGPTLNFIKNNFFKKIAEEHARAYETLDTVLYDISFIDNEFKLDLSPLGVNILSKERFIFIDSRVLKEITFFHKDELTKDIHSLFSIYFKREGEIFFELNSRPVGSVEQSYCYDLFFDKLFEELNNKNLIFVK